LMATPLRNHCVGPTMPPCTRFAARAVMAPDFSPVDAEKATVLRPATRLRNGLRDKGDSGARVFRVDGQRWRRRS